MLVAPPPNSPITALPTGASAGDTPAHSTIANARAPATTPDSKPAPPTTEPAVTVELSSSHDLPPVSTLHPVYAEIWKNGIKIASVDRDGIVTSLVGPIAPALGGPTGGPLFAAIRAAQIAQSMGGELRSNGLTVDAGTLRNRVHLETTYGR